MSSRATTQSSNGRLASMNPGDRPPIFAEPLHVGRPNLGNRAHLLELFGDVLDRAWLTNDGPNVRAFEAAIAQFLGVKHCVAVSNATIGLQIAIAGLELSGEVIVPSFTFPATAYALSWQGIRPVFCDVDPITHNLDPVAVEKAIGPETTGILGVHLWGNPCAIDALTEIANRHGLQLFFDAAHAFGCSHAGSMVGNFGRAEVFSFHATKFINTGEGGAVVTNDDELASKFRRLRNFGIEAEQPTEIGINGKMNEFAAAMGLSALDHREAFVARNQQNFAAYDAALAGLPGVKLFRLPTKERRNQQYIVVEIHEHETGISRDEIVKMLHAENILAKRYFYPGCHRLAPYRITHEDRWNALPNTEALCDRLLQLPTGMAVSQREISIIGNFLRNVIMHGKAAA